jgi:hypothetical protein
MAFYIVVTADAFRMGGRETFLSTYLDEMINRENCQSALLAPHISEAVPHNLLSCGVKVDGAGLEEIHSWIEKGSTLLRGNSNTLIWSQHYRMLPAWLLSALFRRPIVPTFHGPLTNRNAVGTKLDALGLTLVLHRLPLITVVSQEVSETIQKVADKIINIRLLQNRVRDVERIQRATQRRIQMLLLTRYDKLQHIRSAVELAGRWRRLVGPAELVVYSDAPKVSHHIERSVSRRFLLVSEILGRRWIAQGLDRFTGTLLTRFEPPTDNPEKKVAQSDIVLGMGRALLEGVAAGRPSILVGYERVVGLVTNENFPALRFSNFSGRGVPSQNLSDVVKQTARALIEKRSLSPEISDEVSISKGWGKFWTTIIEAASVNVPTANDRSLAEKFIRVCDSSFNEDEFLTAALPCLQPKERHTFQRLMALAI